MRYAIVDTQTNRVVNVIRWSGSGTLDVGEDCVPVASESARKGDGWDGSEIVPKPRDMQKPEWTGSEWVEGETDTQREAREEAEAQAERDRLDSITVNRAQGKAVLADQGYLSAIRAMVDNEPEESLLRIGFEDSPTWKRGSAFINQMLDALELTEAQGDALFQAAAEIEL